jgi:hypothetical protein
MSSFTRPRPRVKQTRQAARSARPFGEGIVLDRSERRMPYSAADLEWATSGLNRYATDYEVISEPSDAALEFAAGGAMAQARFDAGYPLF